MVTRTERCEWSSQTENWRIGSWGWWKHYETEVLMNTQTRIFLYCYIWEKQQTFNLVLFCETKNCKSTCFHHFSLLKKLDKERQTVVKYNTKRMKQLVSKLKISKIPVVWKRWIFWSNLSRASLQKEFIEEHIPEPTEEAISKWAKQVIYCANMPQL